MIKVFADTPHTLGAFMLAPKRLETGYQRPRFLFTFYNCYQKQYINGNDGVVAAIWLP